MINLITHSGLTMIIINYILFLIALCVTGIVSVILEAVIRIWLQAKPKPKNKVIFWDDKEED